MAAIDTIADRSTGTTIAGKAYFETSTNKFIVYNGSAWIQLDSDGVGAVPFENRWGASFDGSGDYIDIAADASLNTTGDWSFSAWIYADDLYSYKAIAAKRTSGTDWQFAVSGGKLNLYLASGGTTVDGSTTLSEGSWYHVVFTVEVGVTNGVKLFVNGAPESNTGTNLYSSNNLSSGMTFGDNTKNRWWDGSFDEMAMFHAALSQADITKIYNSGVPTDLTLAASYDTDRTSNLAGYWRMGDASSDSATSGGSIATITDSSGNGNDATQGTASSQPTFEALDQSVGTTLSFDGSNDYLTVTQNSDINITGDLTVSAWVRLSEIAGYNAVLTKRAVGGSMNYQFTIDPSGQIGLGHSGGSWVYDTNSLTVDTWYHLAATVSSGTVQFYIDGVAKSSSSGLTITGDTNDMSIGATPGYNYFSGKIDEVAVFNTALTQPNITSLATSQTAHIKDDLSLTPVAYYRMGEDDSLTDGDIVTGITDASGNGHHATTVATAQPTASIDPVIYV